MRVRRPYLWIESIVLDRQSSDNLAVKLKIVYFSLSTMVMKKAYSLSALALPFLIFILVNLPNLVTCFEIYGYRLSPPALLSSLWIPPTSDAVPLDDKFSTESSKLVLTTQSDDRLRVGGIGLSNMVFCYPSQGGMLILPYAASLDLDFLSLPRFPDDSTVARSGNAAEEDSFCERMRRVGGSWWESEDDFFEAMAGGRQLSQTENQLTIFAWPSFDTRSNAQQRGQVPIQQQDFDEEGLWALTIGSIRQGGMAGSGRLWNAGNMKSRAEGTKKLGGKHYKSWQEWERQHVHANH